MGKIKDKIKKGKDKVVEWTEDHIDEIVLVTAGALTGVVTCISGFMMGSYCGFGAGRELGKQEGVTVTELAIRKTCPEAAKLIDDKFNEIEQKRLEESTD